jgi:membrane fusion protein (multidrug efflux system)
VLAPGTALTTLQSVSPIHAEFYLPQQTLSELQLGMPARLSTDAFPGKDWDGRITTINTEVDVTTRNVRVRATFQNPDGQLRPGMFANVDVLSPDKRPALAIPATSVLYAPFGDSVFLVLEKKEADGKPSLVAQQKFVRLGERRGDLIAVESGIAAGDTVVSSGAFKLRNGAPVMVKNDLAPDVQVNPHPTDR